METRTTECLKCSLVRPERRTKKHTSFQYGAYRRVRECRVDVDCQRSIKSEKNVLHQKTKTVCSQERKVHRRSLPLCLFHADSRTIHSWPLKLHTSVETSLDSCELQSEAKDVRNFNIALLASPTPNTSVRFPLLRISFIASQNRMPIH